MHATWSRTILADNPMMGTSKVADMMDSKAIDGVTEVVTMEAEGVIEVVFMAAEIADDVTETVEEMMMLVETGMILMRNAHFLRKILPPSIIRL